jgi:hypothetical protein
MSNNIRIFLWVGLGLALWINYTQWEDGLRSKGDAANDRRRGRH